MALALAKMVGFVLTTDYDKARAFYERTPQQRNRVTVAIATAPSSVP